MRAMLAVNPDSGASPISARNAVIRWLGAKAKNEVFATLDHAREHGLNQWIAGIDEDVKGLEAVTLEGKLNHLIA
jgi:hypothetical protein